MTSMREARQETNSGEKEVTMIGEEMIEEETGNMRGLLYILTSS